MTFSSTVAPLYLERSDHLADLAYWALEQEALLSPKPGLVDSRGTGSHEDMDLALMLKSARCLKPFFQQMADAALQQLNTHDLRQEIGLLGRQAESAMLKATKGINTHRGAIWALGLLVAAAASSDNNLQSLLERVAQLALHPDDNAPLAALSNGQQVCKKYQLSGAKEEAQQGFPHLRFLGLPTLTNSRESGDPEPVAQLNALLAIMSSLPDTCVLSRTGLSGLATVQQGAKAIIDAGGCGSLDGRRALLKFEQKLLALKASSGGAADLLAATLFVDSLLTCQ
jgi:triphosphoribosyl-dephospho-CoA synthase